MSLAKTAWRRLSRNGRRESGSAWGFIRRLAGAGQHKLPGLRTGRERPGHPPGYWSSGAYWNSGSAYNLYYGVDERDLSIQPWPIYLYQLQSSGSPISGGPSAHTTTVFCGNPHAPTPSISANGASGGLLWAVESSNSGNPDSCITRNIGPAVLHAYNAAPASGVLASLYSSGTLQTGVGQAVNFPTPTVFNGRAYMGTKAEVDVFGLCGSQPSGCLP
jgi:hypothetical protein